MKRLIPVFVEERKDCWIAYTEESPYMCLDATSREEVLVALKKAIAFYEKNEML
jgi:predicted RNase H-like HicB family nuclease